MAKNDIILIDGIIDERIKAKVPSCDKGEALEYLANEQILKNFDLSKDELENGSVDGRNDGGIDSFYLFVNGILFEDANDFQWPKKHCDITAYIITCKHQSTFTQQLINDQFTTINDIFDFSKSEEYLERSYNRALLNKRNLLKEAYFKTASYLNNLSFKFYNVSRGDTSIIDDNIKARVELIGEKINDFFLDSNFEYKFLGSTELLTMYRDKPQYELELYHRRVISYSNECHIVLCSIKEYYRFITDADGNLLKYLFDSNVRDYMGANLVNEDILATLQGDKNVDFWWLNNGITILASSAINLGQFLRVQNVQIVNGLQTSQTIYNYVKNGGMLEDENRCVMIKIISQDDTAIRDQIIRSTNNQTAIQPKSLFATDKKQRDIEDIMKKYDWYYERRTNSYANQNVPKNKIVDIMYVAAGYQALILKNLRGASSSKQRKLKNQRFYNQVFNEVDPLTIWPRITEILKRVDSVLLSNGCVRGIEGTLKRTRYLVATIVLARIFGTFNFNISNLLKLDVVLLSDSLILDTWKECIAFKYDKKQLRSNIYIHEILQHASDYWKIPDVEGIIKRKH